MKLLLDTHIWLWYLLSDPSLSPSLQTTIVAPDTELWLSPITLWETLMLAEKGRINLQPNPEAWIDRALTILPTKEATLNHTIARLSRQLPYFARTAVAFTGWIERKADRLNPLPPIMPPPQFSPLPFPSRELVFCFLSKVFFLGC